MEKNKLFPFWTFGNAYENTTDLTAQVKRRFFSEVTSFCYFWWPKRGACDPAGQWRDEYTDTQWGRGHATNWLSNCAPWLPMAREERTIYDRGGIEFPLSKILAVPILLSLSSCINIECIVLNNASTHEIRETFIRLLKTGKLPHRANGPLRAPIICLNYAIEPKRLALYINTMLLLLLFLLLFLWLSSLLLLHWNNVIPYIFVGRLTDHTHNLKLE